jgi:hypothetical protein
VTPIHPASNCQNGRLSISRVSFQKVAHVLDDVVPGSGVSSRTHVSPGRAPVWSVLDTNTTLGSVTNEQANPALGPLTPGCAENRGGSN